MSHVPPTGPVNPPTRVNQRGTVRAAVVASVNSDGTLTCRLRLGRAAKRAEVYVSPAPAVGDRVLLVDLDGDPNTPAVIAVAP